jgi:pseudouridine synthase
MSEERLHKFLARCGVASRRAAEKLIAEGRVRVNGKIVREQGTKIDAACDAIRVDGRRIRERVADGVYVAFHKPRNVVTTMSDPEGRPAVGDWIEGRFPGRVYPVGRLDFGSEGLLLLTNDGGLSRDLQHPGRKVPKVYRVKLRGCPQEQALQRIRDGIRLEGRRTAPARVRMVKRSDNPWIEITVTEGRKHLVRRLFESVGYPVTRLRRIAIGGVQLGDLRAGRFRALTADEIASLRAAASGARPGSDRGGRTRSRRS